MLQIQILIVFCVPEHIVCGYISKFVCCFEFVICVREHILICVCEHNGDCIRSDHVFANTRIYNELADNKNNLYPLDAPNAKVVSAQIARDLAATCARNGFAHHAPYQKSSSST